jgi:hypothetical protein
MQLNELQRTEYLAALGVTSYMPRFLLPLAPEPRQAELPVVRDSGQIGRTADLDCEGARESLAHRDSEPGSAELQLRSRAAGPLKPTGASGSALRDIGELTEQVRAVPAPQAAPLAEVASPQSQVQPFVLSCWWLGEELLAVDSREPGTALPLEALFDNIARALNWHQLPRERDRLRWPMAENRYAAAADASDARDTCASWLEAACARKPVKSIWLMGRQARDFCSPVPLTQLVSEWNGIRLLAMPSLSQLLQQPLRKRDLWQLLQKTYPEQTRI